MTLPALAPCLHAERMPIPGGLLSRCKACGLVATAQLPDFTYAEDYFVDEGSGYDFESEFARAFDAERFEHELAGLEAQGLHGTILDVGCAVGTFLFHAQARGWKPAGVEVAAFARKRASERLGIPVRGALDELPTGERYDVVTLHHVLEHIDEPVRFLATDVAPRVGRHLLIEVPNFASLAAQSEGAAWKDLRPEQHVHHFEPDTLRACVNGAGFDVLRVETLSDPLWSLFAARRTVASLRALAVPGVFRPQDVTPAPRATAPEHLHPAGLKAVAVAASRIALRPLVRWFERTGRGERLVLEARPRSHRT